MPESHPLRPGDPQRLGDFRLVGLLGEGGQGVVYLGVPAEGDDDPPAGKAAEFAGGGGDRRCVAVKLLRAHLSGDPKARRYFAKEVEAARRIAPDYTARILHADVDGDTPYIVSEYVDGPSLYEEVRAAGPVTGAELGGLALGTIEALVAIHRASVVHRDLKPSNVLLGPDGPRVIDFGIARALDITISVTSGIVGTPAYMAPEQLNGQTITPAVDMFAWGATMTFAALGRGPFGGEAIGVVMNRILNAPADLGALRPPLREIVSACLAKDPAWRPTAEQVLLQMRGMGVIGQLSPQESGDRGGLSAASTGPAAAARPTPAPGPPVVSPFVPEPGPPLRARRPDHAASGAPQLPHWTTSPPSGTRPPWGRGGARIWIPALAAALGVALIATVSVVAMNLLGRDRPPGTSGSPVTFNQALTKTANPSARIGGTLKLVNAGEIDSLDPGNTYQPYLWNFTRLYARPLMTYAAAPGRPRLAPDLAEAPGRPSADLQTWTYKLRSGLKFDDGTPVTSQDVKYAVARTFAREALPQGPSNFRELLAAGDYSGPYKQRDLERFTGVTTPDDRTVVFHLKRPHSEFDHVVAIPQTAPVPRDRDRDRGEGYGRAPISTGPYRVAGYQPGKSLSLVRNPVWDARTDPVRRQRPERIEVTLGLTPEDAAQRVISGDADAELSGAGLPSSILAGVLADPARKRNLDQVPTGGVRFVALSTKVTPLDNVDCRRAVQHAADRAAMIQGYGAQENSPATRLLPENLASPAGSPAPARYPGGPDRRGDVEKAKERLAACGRPNGFAVNLAARADRPNERAAAQVLVSSLARVGIRVTLRQFPSADYLSGVVGSPDRIRANGLGLMMYGWSADFPTGMGFLPQLTDGRTIRSSVNTNVTELADPKVDQGFDLILSTADPARRETAYRDVEDAIMERAVIMPVADALASDYRNPGLTNVVVNRAYAGYDMTQLGATG